jgi:uncharacterized protein (DUF697 family)
MSTATAEITNNSQESGLSRSDASSGLIKSACAWAAASSLIPLSGADIAALAAVQANLVINISSLYGEKVEKYAVSGVIATLLGTLLPAYAATYALTAAAKVIPIPGVGSLLSFPAIAGSNAAATYAVGRVFVSHYENGGTFASFSPTAAKDSLMSEFAAKKAS